MCPLLLCLQLILFDNYKTTRYTPSMPKTNKYNATLYNPDWLKKVYIDEDRNAAQVAELIGCTRGAVLDRLRKYNLPIKDVSEAQKRAKFDRGSTVPRPREEFKDTLHNPEWMKTHAHLSLTSVAEMTGSSPPSVAYARQKQQGLQSRASAFGREKTNLRAKSHEEARSVCPEDACKICSGSGEQVNHIDRDWSNNDPNNLERLCLTCHRHQHSAETVVMMQMLKEAGFSYRTVWERARALIETGGYEPYNRVPARLLIGTEMKSVEEWAEVTGIRPVALRARLMAGWDPQEAVTTPPFSPKEYEVYGFRGSLGYHAAVNEIPTYIVYNRMQRDWDILSAVTTPINCHRNSSINEEEIKSRYLNFKRATPKPGPKRRVKNSEDDSGLM